MSIAVPGRRGAGAAYPGHPPARSQARNYRPSTPPRRVEGIANVFAVADSSDAAAQAAADTGFERVQVELDWYDGPRGGVADVGGLAHYFRAVEDYARPGEPDNLYLVWPISEEALAWEREQWAIFVAWNSHYESGAAGPDSHPGRGGVDARYDQLTALLAPHRQVPNGARRLAAQWRWSASGSRYRVEGVDYQVRWHTTAT
jgi:hypothetical protein